MSAFVPDQFDQMSKKELLEFAMTAHEENVKLVKRVKKLESAIEKLCATHFVSCDLDNPAEKLNSVLRISNKWMLDPSVSSDAAKFALEQKIEALQELLRRKSYKGVHHLIEIVIDSYKNQLRKEQE